MSFDSTDPLTARLRFKSRSVKCLVALGVVFVVLVVVMSWVLANSFDSFTPMLIGDALVLVVCYFLYVAWHDQPVKLSCPHCDAILLSNTPWVCGYCKQTNRNANEFPFVHECAHCGDEAKAYRCHHCGELIFLTEDKSKLNYAHSLNSPKETLRPDEHAEMLKKLQADREVKEAELNVALVDDELNRLRKLIEPQMPKKKPAKEILKEELDAEMEWETAEAELLAAIEAEHKGNPKLKNRLKAALKKKIQRGLADR